MQLHPEVRAELALAIQRALTDLQSRSVVVFEPSLVWRREAPGRWSGVTENVPTLGPGFFTLPWGSYAAESDRLLREHHADHCELVGTPLLGQNNIPVGHRLMNLLSQLWRLHGSFIITAQSIDQALDELSRFIDSTTIETHFTAPLLNFSGPDDVNQIRVIGGVQIVRLSNDQVTRIFGGSPFTPSPLSLKRFAPIEWAFEGTIQEPKLLGTQPVPPSSHNELRQMLDQGLLTLRTFRSGPVGYDFVRLSPVGVTPYLLGEIAQSFGDTYVPHGSYNLANTDLALLERHASLVTGGLHSSLGSACSRLAEGEIRLQARDKIFDAVVGLEAILLADTTEKYRGELRYRFAMNYATLFDAPSERMVAFRLAKVLYDLRSDIAHGSALSDSIRMGGDDLPLAEVGSRACEILRTTIVRFLPEAQRPSYLVPDYWPSRQFRIDEEAKPAEA